ncbi:MAG TPA: beta-ribofuranosylaminobenzene 5'-phosphate synthase family protein [Methylophilaceae bacterium]|jgi:beta-RFAP synthase
MKTIRHGTKCVSVKVTARLHLGFIDMHGGLGRRFGSIGLALDSPSAEVMATARSDFTAEGEWAERVVQYAQDFAQKAGINGGAHFSVQGVIPRHAGLGSGTQMGLAVGSLLSALYGLGLTVQQIAAITERGARSGIGIGAFEQGGLLVDGGRGADTVVPPILARMDFPAEWRVLLVMDDSLAGVHGAEEVAAFNMLPEFPAQHAARISHLTLMQLLPALAEQNLPAFGAAVTEIQHMIGDYFAPAQGGGRYASAAVAEAMQWLEQRGISCLGQSSWGPTAFAIFAKDADAQQFLHQMQQKYPELRYAVSGASNAGCVVDFR